MPNIMHFSKYYKKLVDFSIFCAILLIILPHPFHKASAQTLSSRQQKSDFEQFERLRTTNRDSAYIYAERLANDIDSTAVGDNIALIYDFMAEYSETTLHRYTKALGYRLESARIYEALDNSACLTRTNALLGRIYLRNGDYHSAFSHSTKALNEAKRSGDTTSEREAYLVLEQVTYFYHNDIEAAMEYNRLVAEHYENREQAHQAVRALNNRFNYPLSYDKAIELTERSEALCKEFKFNDLLINVYLNISMQALEHNNFADARRYLDLAYPLLSNFKEDGYYYSASGFYNLMTGNTQQAIIDLKHSIELLGQEDFNNKNVHSYFLLQDIYFNLGLYREAYEALMAFAETYTRQHNTSNIVKLSMLINELELEKRQSEMEQLERYNNLLRGIHTFGFVAMILLLVLLFSRYRLQRKNNRLMKAQNEQELNHKTEIIRLQKLQQYQEHHNIEKLTEELLVILNTQDGRTMRNELKHTIKRLQKDSDTSSDWTEVEKVMEANNDAFFENLIREYPNLTKNERKLCVFIHMNLSTKEISKISHQSIGSINIARSRLRKKFGITGDDKSLIAFLDRFDAKTKEE